MLDFQKDQGKYRDPADISSSWQAISTESSANYNRLVFAIEQIQEGVVVLDEDQIIKHANLAFEKITGFSRERVIGSSFSSFQLGPVDLEIRKKIFESLKKKSEWHDIYTSQKKSGLFYEEEATYAVFQDKKNQTFHYVIVFQDVSERRRFEAIAESVEMMKNMGSIFSGVRHELANPINSIKMAMSVLKKNIETYSKDKIIEFVDRSLTEIGRVEYLLGTLRTFSMHERLTPEKVKVTAFFEKFSPLVKQDLLEKKVSFLYFIDENVEEMLVDTRALHQILINLLSNSLDALKTEPNPYIHIHILLYGNMLQIRVADNGEGIKETQKTNLFKPFYTSKTNGNGLGLMIVKKMVTEMNGTIEIESVPNTRTEAIITLPHQSNNLSQNKHLKK